MVHCSALLAGAWGLIRRVRPDACGLMRGLMGGAGTVMGGLGIRAHMGWEGVPAG
ncbi:MAG TPA: hypothetical protein VM536_19175 [Chloroflexia bacterium]|nr:hypothetical protein [Chloroflexia bacterium]